MHRRGIRRTVLPGAFCLLSGIVPAALPAKAQTELATASAFVPLSAELETRLAERFAPAFVFHPAEQYFPVSPLFTLTTSPASAGLSDADSLPERLGTPADRIALYRKLDVSDKDRLATVYYRAYWGDFGNDGDPAVMLEYWLYYVENDYRLRLSPFPFSFNATHPNDLEHVHLVLRPDGGDPSGFVLEAVYASAHEGTMPANRYVYPAGGSGGPIRILVELGSHAMAPDIDGDGSFAAGADGDSAVKLLWGIRDHGAVWVKYSTGYMDPRDENAWRVVPMSAGSAIEPGDDGKSVLTYELLPVSSLRSQVSSLSLSEQQRTRAFENRRNPVSRLFGADNGSAEKLLLPPPADTDSIGIRSPSSYESGVFFGPSLGPGQSGLFLGARRAFLNGRSYLPDVMLELDGTLARKETYLSSRFLLTYPIHAFTRVFVGRELLTGSVRLAHTQWGWTGGMEFRVGHLRIRGSARTPGPVSRLREEVRVAYLF
jgi:hypothetical protein